jgi:predicted ATP-binding protein involved in virulence
MKLKSVELQNYRCYKGNDFNFGTDCTIVIGKNGTGKSSLLSALRKGMTFIFSNTGTNELIKNNVNKVEGLEDWDTTFIENGDGFLWPTNIHYQISYDKTELDWNFFKDKYKGKLKSSYYKDAQKKFEKHFLSKSSTLPLLGFYGDCYPHKRKDSNSIINSFNKILLRSKVIPRDAGYFLWNSDESIVSSWFTRTKFLLNEILQDTETISDLIKDIEHLESRRNKLSNTEGESLDTQIVSLNERLKLLQKKSNTLTIKFEEEFDFIKEKVMCFFSKVNEFDKDDLVLFDIKKRRTEKGEYLFFNFGTDTFFNEGVYNEASLPMGYQRLIHIVYDVAYRWYILNGKTETYDGLVLIDELELHLHPSLQQTVVQRLLKTFPGMQFIITTHSPIILSNFIVDGEKTKIIQLERNDGEYSDEELGNLYTMDYNANLTEVMGVNISDKELDTLISAYNFLKNEHEEDSAKKYYDLIKDFFSGNIPGFVKEKIGM